MTTRDKAILGVVGAIVAIAAYWFLLLSPQRKQAADVGRQVAAQRQTLQQAQADLSASRAARASYAADYATVARLGKAVPVDDDVSSLVYELQSASSVTRVDFRSIKLLSGDGGTGAGTGASGSSPQGATGSQSGSGGGSHSGSAGSGGGSQSGGSQSGSGGASGSGSGASGTQSGGSQSGGGSGASGTQSGGSQSGGSQSGGSQSGSKTGGSQAGGTQGGGSQSGSGSGATGSQSGSGSTAGAPATQAAAAGLPPGATVGSAGFPTMPFAFTFEGNFFHLSDFFRKLERYVLAGPDRLVVNGRLLTVDGIALTPSPEGFPKVTASIVATAYLLPDAEGLLAGATPTGPGGGAAGGGTNGPGASATSAPAPAATPATAAATAP